MSEEIKVDVDALRKKFAELFEVEKKFRKLQKSALKEISAECSRVAAVINEANENSEEEIEIDRSYDLDELICDICGEDFAYELGDDFEFEYWETSNC